MNLKIPIQIEDIADVAFYSKYHFQRLFSLLIGEAEGSYLKKRRLTEAARELVKTERNIINSDMMPILFWIFSNQLNKAVNQYIVFL